MTKSTITREESIQAVFDLKVGYRLGFADIESLKRVARMALAAMDSEPMAHVDPHCVHNITRTDYGVALENIGVGAPRFAAPQSAPVVPQEVLKSLDLLFHRSYFRRWVKDPQGYVAGSIPVSDMVNVVLFADACRAAMLAVAPQSPGSDPAAVPGKWIPVSERIPEVGVKVLCFPVEDEPIHAVFNGQLWLQDISWSNSDEPIDNVITCNVTHWMPLPAAPQEGK